MSSLAQDVELTALTGEVTIEGELLWFDGQSYSIGIVLGNLILDAAIVRCDGAA